MYLVHSDMVPNLLHMILHYSHMQDLWTMMKPLYDELVRNPPKDKQLCPCIKDVKNNQVLKYLKWLGSEEHLDYEISEVFDYNEIYDYWMDKLRPDFLKYYEEKSDSYSAAMFIYCMLNE